MPKRTLDRFDLEAEREGSSIATMSCVKSRGGRRTAKTKQKQARGTDIITTKKIKREGWSPR